MSHNAQVTDRHSSGLPAQVSPEGGAQAPAGGTGASLPEDQFLAHQSEGHFDSLIGSTNSNDPATQIKQQFASQLRELAGDKDAFHALMKQAFGDGYDQAAAEGFRQKALQGDFSWMPEIRFVGDSTLGGGYGAFDQENNVIYLNENLKGNLDFAAQVYAEEVGHFLDTQLNTTDTAGDEGEMFRRILAGESLTEVEVAEIRAEDDSGVIVVDGQEVRVEFFFKKLFKGIKKVAKGIWNGVKSVAKGVWKGVKKVIDSGFLQVVFTVMSFIPGLNVIGMIGNAALSVYNGVKNGDWVGAVIGVAGAVAGGATALAGKAASSAASVATKVAKYARIAQNGLKAYSAARRGDWVGAIAGAASTFAGVGADWSDKVAGTLNTVASYASKANTAISVYRAAQRGDFIGAVGIGAGLAADFAEDGTQLDDILKDVRDGAIAARGVEHAIKTGDYLGAATQVTGFLGQVTDGDAQEQLQKASQALRMVDGAHNAIRSKDYAGAAVALTQAASLYGLNPETSNAISVAADRIGHAAAAFDAARAGDFGAAARQLSGLTEGVLDRKTRAHFEVAAEVFERASEIHGLVKNGNYWTAAYRASQAAQQFAPDDAARARLEQASKLIQLAAGANAYVQAGRPEGMLRIIDEALEVLNIEAPAVSQGLEVAADVVTTVNQVKSAIDRGDYVAALNAARSGADRVGLDEVRDALGEVAGAIEDVREGDVGGIIERVFGSEARDRVDEAVDRLKKEAVEVLRGILGGAADDLLSLEELRQAA